MASLLGSPPRVRGKGSFEHRVSLNVGITPACAGKSRTQRGIDSVTDVLSFPVCEFSAPSRFEEAEEDPFGCFDPESGHLLLGDIVICAERVRSQAEEYGHSRRREFAFLTAHSMLHLCGYDHMEPEEEAEMLAKQNEILNALGITREDG